MTQNPAVPVWDNFTGESPLPGSKVELSPPLFKTITVGLAGVI